jgi:glutamate N-acetyltransferase/amino-acid N-acetyltransferase
MSVTEPKGFVAGVASAGFRDDGTNDVVVLINQGPSFNAAAVFTTNQVKAAPVLWSQEAIKGQLCKAVLLNSGGANACTGPGGFEIVHKSAEFVAQEIGISARQVLVCSTGLIGKQLNLESFLPAIKMAITQLSASNALAAASAITTTDSYPKQVVAYGNDFCIGAMIKGAGMLAPNLATMLCVITTDALIDSENLNQILSKCVKQTLNRIDSDGCTSTNDTVIVLSSGASGVLVSLDEFETLLMSVLTQCGELLIGDAEGSTKSIQIRINSANSEEMAEAAARAVARNNLFKAAMFGSDPNWGRILAAVGTIAFPFDQHKVDIRINNVDVCKNGVGTNLESTTELTGRLIELEINFNLGDATATIWTNDLSEKYVYENSAYSS